MESSNGLRAYIAAVHIAAKYRFPGIKFQMFRH